MKAKHDWTPERIREMREAAGMTQEELARRVGVTVATLCRWECGKFVPSKLARARLGEVVKCAREREIRQAGRPEGNGK